MVYHQSYPEYMQFPSTTDPSSILYEDNITYIARIRGGYIKGDITKHVSPMFFYTYKLQENQNPDKYDPVTTLQICSSRHY